MYNEIKWSFVVCLIFSSPDQEVVKVRYSDGAMSCVRRRPTFVINNWVVNSLAVTVLIDWMIIKLCQNVCINEIQIEFEDGLSRVKN
jgi:hypothetical protein